MLSAELFDMCSIAHGFYQPYVKNSIVQNRISLPGAADSDTYGKYEDKNGSLSLRLMALLLLHIYIVFSVRIHVSFGHLLVKIQILF